MNPFLPWPGSKSRCAEEIVHEFPRFAGTYYEPFLGSGAVYFALQGRYPMTTTTVTSSYLSDVNAKLINCWRAVRDNLDWLVMQLNEFIPQNSEEFYMEQRKRMDNAASFLYVMRAAFSSIYRENSQGEFNVPWRKKDFESGRKMAYDFGALTRCSDYMVDTNALLLVREWHTVVAAAEEGDLVYFDPPYLPYNGNGFCEYSAGSFGVGDHVMLESTCKKLQKRGVFVALSNSDTEASRRIFGPPTRQLSVTNAVHAKATKKGKRPEGLWLYQP